MADDKVRKMAEEALNRLSAALDAGRSEALKQYLAAVGRFHRYSWGNVLLINSQRPDATHVAGFHTWHDLGRWVKKGEKGIMILAPMLVKQKDGASAGKEAAKPDEVFHLTGFRTAYVFDASQTEGRPMPEFAKTTGDTREYGEKLKALPIGAYQPRWFLSPVHMAPDEAVRAHEILAAKTSIAIHHGTFQLTDEGIDTPKKQLLACTQHESFLALNNGQSADIA
jgi:N-terminal domain of anti-restriction factor ArdC